VYPREHVVNSKTVPHLCTNIRTAMMNKTETAYRELFRLLESDRIPADFPDACRLLRVLPGALNELILRELGLSGEELLMRWSKMICVWPQK